MNDSILQFNLSLLKGKIEDMKYGNNLGVSERIKSMQRFEQMDIVIKMNYSTMAKLLNTFCVEGGKHSLFGLSVGIDEDLEDDCFGLQINIGLKNNIGEEQ